MKSKIAFIKSSGIYFVGNFLTKLIIFFLLPLYSTYILPEDYGYYDITMSYLSLIIPVLTVEIWIGMYRFILEEKALDKINAIINNGLIIIIFPLFMGLTGFIINFFYFEIKYFNLILLLGLLLIIRQYYVFLCRALSSNKIYIISGILNTLVLATSNLYMILIKGMGLNSLFLAFIFGLIVQIVYIEFYIGVRKRISFKEINKNLIIRLIKFSIPLSFGSLLYFFLNYYNKLTIENMIGLEGNGYYAIATKFSVIIVLLTSAFTLAWQDIVFSMSNNKANREKFEKGTDIYTKFIFGGSAVLILFLHFIFPLIIDEKYSDSYNIIPLSIIAAILAAFGNFISQTLGALKETKIILYSTFITTLINVALVRFFVREYGINGVNITLIISFFINIVIRIAYLRINFKMRFKLWSIPLFLVYLLIITIVFYTNNFYYNIFGLVLSILIVFILLREEIKDLNLKGIIAKKFIKNVDS